MKALRIALIQLSWLGSREAMKAQIQTMTAEAVERGAALVCLPELSLSPYFPGRRNHDDFSWAEALPGGESDAFFSELARQQRVTLVGSLFVRTSDDHYFNTAVTYNPDGQLIGETRKVHIPSGDGYHETDFFEGGAAYPQCDIGGLTMATPTCYDQWFPEMARIHSLKGAEFIFYPTAIGSEPSAPDIDTCEAWQTVMRGQAVANGIYIAAANRTGEENGVRFYGSSFVCDPMGRIIAQAGRDTTEVITADLDPALFQHWRDLFPLLHQRKPATYGEILRDAAQ